MDNNESNVRIGITMRTVDAVGYKEPRDALAHDWYDYMDFAFPGVPWMPIPNMGKDVVDYIQQWNINAIILSGGNDIGTSRKRDLTEKEIISYAIGNLIPLFGVCRGLQLIQHYFGGNIKPCRVEEHVAKEHLIQLTDEVASELEVDDKIIVNSYHSYGIKQSDLNSRLRPFAITKDGWVEGVFVKDCAIAAVMWHPERVQPFNEYDRKLMRRCFRL